MKKMIVKIAKIVREFVLFNRGKHVAKKVAKLHGRGRHGKAYKLVRRYILSTFYYYKADKPYNMILDSGKYEVICFNFMSGSHTITLENKKTGEEVRLNIWTGMFRKYDIEFEEINITKWLQ